MAGPGASKHSAVDADAAAQVPSVIKGGTGRGRGCS